MRGWANTLRQMLPKIAVAAAVISHGVTRLLWHAA
jgi:hypothetical protein